MKLPKNWRAIDQDGAVLYLQRICGRYYVMPELGEWYAYFDPEGTAPFGGQCIGKGPTDGHAMVICREHMHAAEMAAKPFSNNAATAAGDRT